MTGAATMIEAYDALVAGGELKPDAAQRDVAERLDRLSRELSVPPGGPGFMQRLFGAKAPPAPRGLYLWGGVGRGKSMLMDLFFHHADCTPKRRIHFHQFMLETHARIQQQRERHAGDPIAPVAVLWAAEARLLAFDELVVTNIADAMILSRLFTALFAAGVTVVATSNREPGDLYKDGLNRELFLPFIALIRDKLEVLPLNGPTDYRLHRMAGMPTYYVPNGPETTRATSELFFRLTDFPVEDRDHVPSAELDVGGGRMLHVPKSLKGVAVFSFKRLCAEARGAADYLAIARTYHTVIVVGVPVLGPEKRNEAARFVTFVDILYEWRVKLVLGADAPPDSLYPAGDGSFEFERTVSRLMEMQSAVYLAEGHGLPA